MTIMADEEFDFLIGDICIIDYNLLYARSGIDYFNFNYADGVLDEVDLSEKCYWVKEFVSCSIDLITNLILPIPKK